MSSHNYGVANRLALQAGQQNRLAAQADQRNRLAVANRLALQAAQQNRLAAQAAQQNRLAAQQNKQAAINKAASIIAGREAAINDAERTRKWVVGGTVLTILLYLGNKKIQG